MCAWRRCDYAGCNRRATKPLSSGSVSLFHFCALHYKINASFLKNGFTPKDLVDMSVEAKLKKRMHELGRAEKLMEKRRAEAMVVFS